MLSRQKSPEVPCRLPKDSHKGCLFLKIGLQFSKIFKLVTGVADCGQSWCILVCWEGGAVCCSCWSWRTADRWRPGCCSSPSHFSPLGNVPPSLFSSSSSTTQIFLSQACSLSSTISPTSSLSGWESHSALPEAAVSALKAVTRSSSSSVPARPLLQQPAFQPLGGPSSCFDNCSMRLANPFYICLVFFLCSWLPGLPSCNDSHMYICKFLVVPIMTQT